MQQAVEHTVMGEKFYSIYGHLAVDSVTVEVGDKVRPGIQIGGMGNTKTGDVHLHFEIRTSANINLSNSDNPLQGQRYWGYKSSEWENYFVDLGSIYGYNGQFLNMP